MISVERITEPRRERRLELLRAGLERTLRPARGGHYAVKPNLSSCRPASTGATTDAEIVRAIIRHLQDHGARVTIVELPPHVRNLDRVVSLTGYRELARELGARLVVPDSPSEFVAPARLFRVFPCRVARAAWESDGIINVPKVKTHMRAHFTASVKNLMGLADAATRHRIHVWGLHRGVAALYRLLGPRVVLNVLDAVVAMHGQGPTRGDPLRLDTIFLGRDAVACDLHVAAATGIDPAQVDYLARLAAESPSGPVARGGLLASMVPVDNRHPRLDYIREILTTQPALRRLLQQIDFDFISDRRPVLPRTGEPLDHLCRHGAIRGLTLLPDRCNLCHECIGPGSPVVLERGLGHKARVLRELLAGRPT